MKLWFRKVIKCNLCKAKTRKKDTFQLHLKTAEGPHEISICNDCAKTMEQIKDNANLWLEQ